MDDAQVSIYIYAKKKDDGDVVTKIHIFRLLGVQMSTTMTMAEALNDYINLLARTDHTYRVMNRDAISEYFELDQTTVVSVRDEEEGEM